MSNKINLKIIDPEEVPKRTAKRTGAYAEVEGALKTMPKGKVLVIEVPTRPTAAGYQKYFGQKYDVITRTVYDPQDPKKIQCVRVYIAQKGVLKPE